MKAHHTAGPWKASEDGRPPLQVSAACTQMRAGAVEVARCDNSSFGPISWPECYANARLIAQAPRMGEQLNGRLAELEAGTVRATNEATTKHLAGEIRALLLAAGFTEDEAPRDLSHIKHRLQ